MKIKDYEFPDELKYDKYHGWVIKEDELLLMGVTDMFQKMAGEVIFVEVPAVGRKITQGDPFASIESGKWVGRLKASVDGEIVEANAELDDFPYLLNESPYEEGWIIKLKPDNWADFDALMSTEKEDELAAFVEEEEKKIDADK